MSALLQDVRYAIRALRRNAAVRWNTLLMVLRQGMVLTVAGSVLGLAGR